MKNEIVCVDCVDLSIDGYGVARKDNLVLFVKGLLRGEKAEVKIIASKKNYAYGKIEKLLTTSPLRVISNCQVSYKCGGCDLRHYSYTGQVSFKEDVVFLYAKKANLNVSILPLIAAEKIDNYRNKIVVPIKNQKWGYYRKNSNDIVAYKNCLLASKLANDVINLMAEYLIEAKIDTQVRHLFYRENLAQNELMVGFISVKDISKQLREIVPKLIKVFPSIVSIYLSIHPDNNNVIMGEKDIVLWGRDYIVDKLGSLKFAISFRSFYQIHTLQAYKLYSCVLNLAKLSKQDRVLDLYCGIGTISLFVARYVKRVVGVEIIKEAIINAKNNAKLNNIKNVSFYCDDAKNNLGYYLKDINVLIVDPPRKGLASDLISYLLANPVEKIVYVSCNVATFMRDIKLLKEKYNFSAIQPVDMFPNTIHVECIVLMSRVN